MVAWNELPSIGEPAEYDALVELADRLQSSAPELAVQYARRAIVEGPAAGGPGMTRAHGLLSAALVRIGRCSDAVEPALAAVRWAEQAGMTDVASLARLDLAECARELGEPLLGCTILRPVLDTAGGRPATRAGAIWQLAACTVHIGRRDDLEDLLTEADRLLAADDRMSPDARRIERALLAARTAAYHRRYGETEDAVDTAREGLGLLTRLRDGRIEGGRVWARLILELVLALLDDGQPAEAEHEAGPLFAQPVRAASAPAVGRTLLAVATRVMVPVGRVDAARGLLDYVLSVAERHALDWLLADALSLRADLDEQSGRLNDALDGLRDAHAAEHRHRRAVEQARRQLVIEFGLVEAGVDAVTLLLRNVARTQVAVPATEPVPPLATQAPVAEPIPAPTVGEPAPPPTPGPAVPGGTERARPAPSRPDEPAPADLAGDDTDRPVGLTLVRLDLSGGPKPAAPPDEPHPTGDRYGDLAAEGAQQEPGAAVAGDAVRETAGAGQPHEAAARVSGGAVGTEGAPGAPTVGGPVQPPGSGESPVPPGQPVPAAVDRREAGPGDAGVDLSATAGPGEDRAGAPAAGPAEVDAPAAAGSQGNWADVPVADGPGADGVAALVAGLGLDRPGGDWVDVPAAAGSGMAGPAVGGSGAGGVDLPVVGGSGGADGVGRPVAGGDWAAVVGSGGVAAGLPVAGEGGVDRPDVAGSGGDENLPVVVGPGRDGVDLPALAGDGEGDLAVGPGGDGTDLPNQAAGAGAEPDRNGPAGVDALGEPGGLLDGIGEREPAFGAGIGSVDAGNVDGVQAVGAVAPLGSDRTKGGYEEPGTTNWLIRDLLAPLLHHPTLASKEGRDTVPPEPPPDDVPEPPGQPDVSPPRPDDDPGGEPPAPNRPDFAPKRPEFWPSEPAQRPTNPAGPSEPAQRPKPAAPGGLPAKPDEEGKPPRRPDIILPEEPDQIPPISPIPEPTRDVPPPAQLAPGGEPVASSRTRPDAGPVVEPGPNLRTGPSTEQNAGPVVASGPSLRTGPDPEPDTGPIVESGTASRPGPDPEPDTERLAPVEPADEAERTPERVHRRRERTDAISIADLLTEALVAYQATAPNDEEEPSAEPAEPAPDTNAPARRFSPGSGRHRMSDWGNV